MLSSHMDQPIVPISNIDIYNPPVSIQVNVAAREVNAVVPLITGNVLQIASSKAYANTGRMFTYNVLVNNYWQNNEVVEAVQLATDLYTLGMVDRIYPTMELGAADAADRALLYITCINISTRYPALKGVCPPEVLRDAGMVTMEYNSIQQRIAALYNRNGAAQPQPQYQQQQQPQYQQQPQSQYNRYTHQDQQYNSNSVFGGNNNAYSNNTNSGVKTKWTEASVQPTLIDPIQQSNFFKTEAEVVKPVQPTVVSTPIAEPTQHLFKEGITEVDRNKHKISIVGNNPKHSHLDNRYKNYEQSIDQLVITRPILNDPIKVPTMELDEQDVDLDAELMAAFEEVYADPPAPSVCSEVVISHTLDQAIISTKVKQLVVKMASTEPSSWNIYRTFNVVTNPIFNLSSTHEYFAALKDCDSFDKLVIRMKAIVQSLEINDDTEYYVDILGYLTHIDTTLTDMVNNYLQYELGLSVYIENFVDDIADLYAVLSATHEVHITAAMKLKEDAILKAIFQHGIKTDELFIVDLPKDMVANPLLVPYSITMLELYNKELELAVRYEPTLVLFNVAPFLYKIISSLKQHKKDMSIVTYQDLLVTADGVKYVLDDSVLKGGFTIRKM